MTKPRHTEEHVATPEADGVGVLCRGDRDDRYHRAIALGWHACSNRMCVRSVARRGPHMITRGFQGRRIPSESKRLPPGQHATGDFPVLSAGPTPHTPLDAWSFALEAEDGSKIVSWSWEEFRG